MPSISFRVLLCIMSLPTMVACSHSNSQSTQFMQYAETLPPITVPPGIKNPTAESYYSVFPVHSTAPLGTEPPLEPPGSDLTVKKQIKLPVPQ